MSLTHDFRLAIQEAESAIASIVDELAEQPIGTGGWSRKQLVGHLIDSALHNHVRFLSAANAGFLQVKTYDQEACVRLHGYADMTWAAVVGHWRHENDLVARLVERLPATSYASQCTLASGEVVTLEWLIRDYLRHLSHHIEQMR
jgi:hypothetical protein